MEPEARSADDVIPHCTSASVPLTVTLPVVALVVVSEPSTGTSSSSSNPPKASPVIPSAPPNASVVVPAPASAPPMDSVVSAAASTSDMTADEEDRVAASLLKNMPVFGGGSKGEKDWPLFWARLSSIMKLSRYSPLGSALVTTSRNAGNSHRLHFLLLSKLTDATMSSFYHNPEFEGKGFEMVAHLCQEYAPSKASDVFVNLQKLMFMELKAQETIPEFVARIRTTNALLQAGGETINPSLLTMLLMRNLPDDYESLKADCALYPERYATMSLSTLEKRVIRWTASNKIYSSSGLSAAAAVVGGGSAVVKGNQPSPPPPALPHLNHEHISKMRSDGICHCHRKDGHKFENCGQFLMAGYVVEFNPEKAKEKKAAKKKKGKKPQSATDSTAASACSSVIDPSHCFIVGFDSCWWCSACSG